MSQLGFVTDVNLAPLGVSNHEYPLPPVKIQLLHDYMAKVLILLQAHQLGPAYHAALLLPELAEGVGSSPDRWVAELKDRVEKIRYVMTLYGTEEERVGDVMVDTTIDEDRPYSRAQYHIDQLDRVFFEDLKDLNTCAEKWVPLDQRSAGVKTP